MPRWLALPLTLLLWPLPARADAPIGPVARLLFPSAYADSTPRWEVRDAASRRERAFSFADWLDQATLDHPPEDKGYKAPLAKAAFRTALFLGAGLELPPDVQSIDRLRRVELPYEATPPPVGARAART